jgi:hypothetical protein
MGEQSAVAQRAAPTLAAHVAEPLPAVQDAERQLAVARAAVRRSAVQRAERLPAAQVPHAERVQREAPHAVPALQGRGARPALLLLRLRPYAAARRLSSPLPRKR